MWFYSVNVTATYKHSLLLKTSQQPYEVGIIIPNLKGGNEGLDRWSDLLEIK